MPLRGRFPPSSKQEASPTPSQTWIGFAGATLRPPMTLYVALGLRNLAALWCNYRGVGAERLIIVDIVETRPALDEYRAAIPEREERGSFSFSGR